MNDFYWLVKREFWEHRGGFLWAPVIASGILLAVNLLALIAAEVFTNRMNIQINGSNVNMLIDQLQKQEVPIGTIIDMSMLSAAWLPMAVLAFVVFFYCLGALYDDRRDRSVLLWKSLPLADRDVVLSKVFSAGVLAPVIAVIVGVLAGLVMLVMTLTTASLHGVNLWPLLLQGSPLRLTGALLALIPINLAWALPTLGWLLLCSAWARGKPFVWAVATPVLVGIMISWLALLDTAGMSATWFWQHIVQRILLGTVPMGWLGNWSDIFSATTGKPADLINAFSLSHAWAQLAQPAFWIGILAGVAMIIVAIRIRRVRSEL